MPRKPSRWNLLPREDAETRGAPITERDAEYTSRSSTPSPSAREDPGSPSARSSGPASGWPASSHGPSRAPTSGLQEAAEDARVVALMEEARAVTDRLVAPVHEEDWCRSYHPALGPVAWDVVHIAQQEDFWLAQVLGGLNESRPGENRTYDPAGNPRSVRAGLPLLAKHEADRFRDQVRARTLQVLRAGRRDGSNPHWRDLFLHKMIVQHEAMHDETIIQHLAAYPPGRYVPRMRRTKRRCTSPAHATAGFVHLPGGTYPMGTRWRSTWTFDNEWPPHAVHVDPFWLARCPVTNRMFLRFIEDGGYRERKWWREDGWRWLTGRRAESPLYWEKKKDGWWRREMDRLVPLDLQEPVVHVSWYEADACARYYGCRLPTEEEWEYAALWDPQAGRKRTWPWGEREPEPRHANLDHTAWGPEPVGSHPEGTSGQGIDDLIGDVWEWTATAFGPYPGFEPFPYRGYSQPFFTGEYRVLRGGSWASRASLRLGTMRNWDYPVRRQIFAGLRLAADEPPAWAPENPRDEAS